MNVLYKNVKCDVKKMKTDDLAKYLVQGKNAKPGYLAAAKEYVRRKDK